MSILLRAEVGADMAREGGLMVGGVTKCGGGGGGGLAAEAETALWTGEVELVLEGSMR